MFLIFHCGHTDDVDKWTKMSLPQVALPGRFAIFAHSVIEYICSVGLFGIISLINLGRGNC